MSSFFIKTFLFFFFGFFLFGFGGNVFVHAQQSYVPLQSLPFAPERCDQGSGLLGEAPSGCGINTSPNAVGSYLQGLFQLAIGVAGALAVLMIVIGGIEYLLSEAFTSKEEAKKRIWAALWGLIIILASFVILNTINPDLLSIKLDLPDLQFRKATKLQQRTTPTIVPPTEREKTNIEKRGETILYQKSAGETLEQFGVRCENDTGKLDTSGAPRGLYLCVGKK